MTTRPNSGKSKDYKDLMQMRDGDGGNARHAAS
jgi:hypothetical protein